MKELLLDGEVLADEAALHREVAEALHFPEWYGANLDAMHDCLTEMSEPVYITVAHWDELSRRIGRRATTLLRVMEDAAEENENLHIACAWSLLPGGEQDPGL